MKIVLVNHYVVHGQIERATQRIDLVTQRMSMQPGLVFRHLGVRKDSPHCLTTVTGWQDDACSSAWNEAARRDPLPAAPDVYTFVESFELDTEIPSAGAGPGR